MVHGRPTLKGTDWLNKQVKKLVCATSEFKDEIEKIKKIKPDVYNEFQAWTPLKLILLNYSLSVCTTIIKKTPIFKQMYYVDLFAGSGINKVKGKNDFLIGSPLISTLKHSDAYDSMIFCENKHKLFEALELRLAFLKKDNLDLKEKDCNEHLDTIIKKIKKRNSYYFFFIDPHSKEFLWKSMKKVLRLRSDIIFTFMTSEIYRAVGLAKKGGSNGEALTKMFGDDAWKNANNADELIPIYCQNIQKERPNAIIKTIKIRSGKYNFCYHMLFITNKTKGNNVWLRAIQKAKEEIESQTDKAVEMALDIVKKRQFTLSQFS